MHRSAHVRQSSLIVVFDSFSASFSPLHRVSSILFSSFLMAIDMLRATYT